MGEDFDYDRWYPEVPAVEDAKQLADLLQTSDQIVRLWVGRGSSPPTAKREAASSTSSTMRSSNGSWRVATSRERIGSPCVRPSDHAGESGGLASLIQFVDDSGARSAPELCVGDCQR
jgi:hypothetical protein